MSIPTCHNHPTPTPKASSPTYPRLHPLLEALFQRPPLPTVELHCHLPPTARRTTTVDRHHPTRHHIQQTPRVCNCSVHFCFFQSTISMRDIWSLSTQLCPGLRQSLTPTVAIFTAAWLKSSGSPRLSNHLHLHKSVLHTVFTARFDLFCPVLASAQTLVSTAGYL